MTVASKVGAAGQAGAGTPTAEEILERARALVPVLRERAAATEAGRMLPAETMADLFDTGLMRLLTPAAYGGYEMGWPMHAQAARVLATACASTAWIVSVVGAHSVMAGRMPKECQDEIWADGPDVLIATGSARTTGHIEKADGGYRVSGTWRFASGVDHSKWVIVTGPVGTDDGPRAGTAFAANMVRAAMPTRDIEIVDTWFVSGMRGTGSKDVSCPDLFVPDHRVTGAADSFGASPPGAAAHSGYLYQAPFIPYFGGSMLGPLLGAAEGAYGDYIESTRVRKSALFRNAVAEQAPVQERLAESSAELKAARLMRKYNDDLLHERGLALQSLSAEEKLENGRDRAYVTRLCLQSVTRLVRQMGAIGISDENTVQRHFRDISAMATQIGVNWDRHMEPYGCWMLGVPTGDARIDTERELPS